MSDDLMIQGVQPQRVSTTPYLLGGAALGGAAGWAGSSFIKNGGSAKTKTYDELVKEANGNDKVELTTKKEAVEKAEKELADASKAVYEGTEKEALDKAIAARDAELAKLTETKTTEGKDFKPKKWDKLGIKASELPTTNERTGREFHTKRASIWEKEVEKEYNRLVADYNRAVADLDARLGTGDSAKLTNYETQIKNYLNDVNTRRARTSVSSLDAIFSPEEPSWRSLPTSAHATEFKEADKAAAKIYPFIKNKSSLTKEQVKSFAEKLEDGATRPSGHNNIVSIREVVDGKVKTVKYTFSDDMFKDFKASENERIKGLQKELRESLLSNAKEHIVLSRKQANFNKEFVDSIPDNLAKKSGMIDGSGKLDITKIHNEAGGKPRFYKQDVSLIEQAIEKNGGAHKTLPRGLKGSYSGAKDLQEALDMVTTRRQLLQDFNTEKNALKKDLEACFKEHTVLNELRDKIAETRNADEAVAKAKEAIFKQFPSLSDGTVEKAGLTTEQAMEKDSYKKLAKIVEEKQAAYDKVAAEKGKINEGAKKTAEDALSKAKAGLEETMTRLNGVAKGLGGKTKAAIIGGTAIVGALVGKGIVDSKNKKIEAEVQNFVANV